MLHQPFSSLYYHLGHPFVAVRKFIKGGVDHLHIGPNDRFPDIRHFLRALIDEQDHQMHVRVIGGNRLCHLL